MGRKKAPLRARWRYWFDNWMSRGPGAIMGLLGIATAGFVIILGTIAWVIEVAFDRDPDGPLPTENLLEYLWNALMRTLDAGTMADDEGWWFRILMLLVTIGGLVIFAGLIGIVSSAFDAKVNQLRQGRSLVLEDDHTLILGWSNKVFTIVQQLAVANESRGRAAIVVLADRDKVEMEEEILANVPDLGCTKVVCRTGDPKIPRDIAIGSPRTARSIILLAPDDVEDPDADVIKTALALTKDPHRGDIVYQIAGELKDETRLGVAQLAGGSEVDWVLGPEIIGRIIVQSCRQAGLSIVYQELLAFEGAECYFTSQPTLVGSTYFEAQLAFPDSTVIGIACGDDLKVNPPDDTVIQEGEELIVIAEDDSTIKLGKPAVVPPTEVSVRRRPESNPEHMVILGANHNLPNMLREFDEFVAAGSHVDIVTRCADLELPHLTNLTTAVLPFDPTRRSVLEELKLCKSDHIIVLPEAEIYGPDVADNRTLATLLLLRDLAVCRATKLNVVSEMLNDANRELAEITEVNDFVVSDKLVAFALAQVSEARRFKLLYDVLFTPSGAEIYLRPAEDYVPLGTQVEFTSVHEAARRHQETAIGYRVWDQARDAESNYGVRVNPDKTERRSFSEGDTIIVLAEE